LVYWYIRRLHITQVSGRTVTAVILGGTKRNQGEVTVHIGLGKTVLQQ